MGCCGEPREKKEASQNEVGVVYPTSQQPSPHPGALAEKQQFIPPSIPSPPPSHAQQFGMTTPPMMQQQSWMSQGQQQATPQGFSLPPGAHNPFQGSSSPSPPPPIASPQFPGMNGMGQDTTFARPSPFPYGYNQQNRSSVMMTTQVPSAIPRTPGAPVIDEGKMSVSIDFGEWAVILRMQRSDLLAQVQRFLEW